jgi:hypothetical protein
MKKVIFWPFHYTLAPAPAGLQFAVFMAKIATLPERVSASAFAHVVRYAQKYNFPNNCVLHTFFQRQTVNLRSIFLPYPIASAAFGLITVPIVAWTFKPRMWATKHPASHRMFFLLLLVLGLTKLMYVNSMNLLTECSS